MEAIIEVSGRQFQVKKGQKLKVNRLEQDVDATVELPVLAKWTDGKDLATGEKAGTVVAKVLGHEKGEKVVSATYKRRKGLHKKKGHRQSLTEIEIQEVK